MASPDEEIISDFYWGCLIVVGLVALAVFLIMTVVKVWVG